MEVMCSEERLFLPSLLTWRGEVFSCCAREVSLRINSVMESWSLMSLEGGHSQSWEVSLGGGDGANLNDLGGRKGRNFSSWSNGRN